MQGTKGGEEGKDVISNAIYSLPGADRGAIGDPAFEWRSMPSDGSAKVNRSWQVAGVPEPPYVAYRHGEHPRHVVHSEQDGFNRR